MTEPALPDTDDVVVEPTSVTAAKTASLLVGLAEHAEAHGLVEVEVRLAILLNVILRSLPNVLGEDE